VIKIIRVVGASMEPSYRSGDYVLVGAARWLFRIRAGDVVVYEHPRLGVLIKRVLAKDRQRREYTVAGTHAESTDPDSLGPAAFSSVIGRVLLRIARPRG
jgi:signal peptidase I